MAAGWLALLALFYILGLFAIASWAERAPNHHRLKPYAGIIYSLALAVYCTSWTFYGAVGSAVHTGWDYIPIYLGPLLVWIFAQPFLRKVLYVSKKYNVTSLTDFISARYGKRHAIAALTALLCLVVVIPYIALQLKAVATSFQLLLSAHQTLESSVNNTWYHDSAFYSAIAMTLFAILFGTRKILLTEQNQGVMLAIAFESVVKLTALLVLALAVLWWLNDNPWQLWHDFSAYSSAAHQGSSVFSVGFFTKTLLAMAAIFLLPRQFHVTFVENSKTSNLASAKYWFSAYLVIVTLVVIPIAVAGIQLFPQQLSQADAFVLLLPQQQHWQALSALVFIGGFSAATSMIIIATLALSTMISNDVVMPALLRHSKSYQAAGDYSQLILRVRRLMIVFVMALAFGYYQLFAKRYPLAETGLLAFALAIQLAPAMIGGLYWRRGHAAGVYAGVSVGFVLWFYCLMLPQLAEAGVVSDAILQHGPWQQSWLIPTALFGVSWGGALDPLSHGVLWSLGLNVLCYVAVSTWMQPDLNDRLQAVAFVKPNMPLADDKPARRYKVSNADVQILLEQFIGAARTQDSLRDYVQRLGRDQQLPPDAVADAEFIAHVERELAGVIGSPSAAAMVEAVLEGRQLAFEDVVTLFDDTRQAIQFSQKILFSTLENLSQGVSVVDRDLQLVAWNKTYLALFDYPDGMVRVGRSIADIVRFNAERGLCGPGTADEHVAKRLQHMRRGTPHVFQRFHPDGRVIEIRGNPIPGGGFVTSFTDITEHVTALAELAAAKQHLEQRVQERTAQISRINADLVAEINTRREIEQHLETAKQAAELANASKTRFLALASHDILQPLNAARLFAATIADQLSHRAAMEAKAALVEDPAAVESKSALLGLEVAALVSTSASRVTASATPWPAAEAARRAQEGTDVLHSTLQHLDNSLKATEELIATLLDIARLDDNDATPQCEPVDVSAIVQQLGREFDFMARQKSLQLRIHCTAQYHIMSQPTYVRRILQNLISNALKYTANGGILIACRPRADAILVQVWDTGPGIASPELAKIFDDFYRVDSTARGQQGVGLGLGVVQRMASRLGHPLAVRSTVGRGSMFSIELPRVVASTIPHAASDSAILNTAIPTQALNPSPISATMKTLSQSNAVLATGVVSMDANSNAADAFHTQALDNQGLAIQVVDIQADEQRHSVQDGTGSTILCIDDDVQNLLALESLISQWQVAKVISCSDPQAWLAQAQDAKIAVAIVDYQLGAGLTAFDIIPTLWQRWPAIPIILVTAAPEAEVLSRAKAMGLVYLAKPIKPAALRSTLQSLRLSGKLA